MAHILGTTVAVWLLAAGMAQQEETDNSVSLYCDGQLVQTIALSCTTIGASGTASFYFYVGVQFNGWELFDGLIDDVAIWDKALTVDEIRIAMTAGPRALTEPSAVLLSLAGAIGAVALCRFRG